MRLVIYEPDIPQNTGAMLRLAACFGIAVDLIEPCGFILDDRRLRRAGMDYLEAVTLWRHSSWSAFCEGRRTSPAGRLLLLTTAGDRPYTDFAFRPGDSLMVGSESRGVPDSVHAAVDARLVIPMRPGLRSLNVALAAALVLGEALRQTGGFPDVAEQSVERSAV
ncbi:tRNA (cytidine(34)-2'-O)-methyltransferase [Rhodospirillaceae bacterium SYSU D60014]|uniref:tRNA (cytidine(34)-2'-O)-methyltransferase n=1 Tax=Virgifigura deserti TaxID=2268457 RepID=UPI000E66E062